MKRYTVTDLRAEVAHANKFQALSLSNYYFKLQGRNGYQAIDLYYTDAEGRERCQSMVEGGTSRECARALDSASVRFSGYNSPCEKLNRIQAKAIAARGGVDFEKDFHAQSTHTTAELLTALAKATKYRTPKGANGSRARYFFAHLQNKVKVSV